MARRPVPPYLVTGRVRGRHGEQNPGREGNIVYPLGDVTVPTWVVITVALVVIGGLIEMLRSAKRNRSVPKPRDGPNRAY